MLRPVAHWAFGEGLEYLSDTEGGKGASLELFKTGIPAVTSTENGCWTFSEHRQPGLHCPVRVSDSLMLSGVMAAEF